MKRFNVLESNRKLLFHLGLYPKLTGPPNEFLKSVTAYHILMIAFVFFIISSMMFVIQNLEQNIGVAIETFIMVIGGIQFGGMFLNVRLNSKTVKALHLKIQEIIDDGS